MGGGHQSGQELLVAQCPAPSWPFGESFPLLAWALILKEGARAPPAICMGEPGVDPLSRAAAPACAPEGRGWGSADRLDRGNVSRQLGRPPQPSLWTLMASCPAASQTKLARCEACWCLLPSLCPHPSCRPRPTLPSSPRPPATLHAAQGHSLWFLQGFLPHRHLPWTQTRGRQSPLSSGCAWGPTPSQQPHGPSVCPSVSRKIHVRLRLCGLRHGDLLQGPRGPL